MQRFSKTAHPCWQRVPARSAAPSSAGLYRAGVADAPENAIAAFMDPLTGQQVYMVDGTAD
jgi:hypothetical protein